MHLGLDIGTSAVKALAIDDAQRILAEASAPLSVSRPRPGWSEQDPAEWLDACERAIDALAARVDLAPVAGIGLSGQMHGATLLGADDRPLRPCMLWNDARAGRECEELDARAPFRAIAGNRVMAGFTAPKVEWVRKHEPEIFERAASILLPKDYVRLWLSGEKVSDLSDAAGTLWLDVAARDWSEELLDACALSTARTPRLIEGPEVSGRLRPELARRWGMEAPVIAGGGGDNAATACGMGVLAPGAGFLSLGTSGVLFAADDAFSPNPEMGVHAFCHAAPDRWHLMGVILSATDSLAWLAELCGSSPAELDAEVAARGGAPARPIFLPYLSGERTPLADPEARGAFVDLDRAAGAAELAAAVMEGVAFAFADCKEALALAGDGLETVWAVGGGARSRVWLETIASATGLTLALPAGGEQGAAFGAARLAIAAARGAPIEEVCAPPETAGVIAPDLARSDALARKLERYRALWPAIREER